jgi:hypothetical protein
MKKIVYILISLIVIGCNSNETRKNETESHNTIEVADSVVSENNFNNCFVEPDSSYIQESIGCSGGYYKLINDQYVLRISSELNVEYGDCDIVSIDSSEQSLLAELLIFEKGKASLTNICTDVILVNAPEPINTLKHGYGQIAIGKTDPTDYYGNEMPKMTIRVDHLTFIDPHTGEEIKIKNELLWKVLNTGTPG